MKSAVAAATREAGVDERIVHRQFPYLRLHAAACLVKPFANADGARSAAPTVYEDIGKS